MPHLFFEKSPTEKPRMENAWILFIKHDINIYTNDKKLMGMGEKPRKKKPNGRKKNSFGNPLKPRL